MAKLLIDYILNVLLSTVLCVPFGAKPSPPGIITRRKILNLLNMAEFQKFETQASVF